MFLNYFAQPTLLTPSKTYLNFEEFKKAPLLVCHSTALEGKLLPKNYSGNIYAIEEILNAIKQKKYKLNTFHTQTLYPNEVYNINLNGVENLHGVKNIELTAIPWDKENVIYLIKADNITNLLTDIITEDLDVLVQNKILRNSIRSGIDVLYINDGVYHNSAELKTYPSECLLGALVTLVRPRLVQGLFSDEPLPQHILNCCEDKSCAVY
ncbi:uncharacterized protein LOC111679403 isoform X1 [Lucilia cuprina]|uniref:uncharacterized protein LOC111679403 isoform X1 n=1 Tax=Lucilia cuprina TaxID=7375 RepID=UPI001F06CCCF|nr:uncharacterized protein LOC111679403 isoform X1 [Lucilia cuprina]